MKDGGAMIGEICAYIKNYFVYEGDRIFGEFSIENGEIVPPVEFPTDYYAIFGSRRNNGVHNLADQTDTLVDEGKFHGSIWIMTPPDDFLTKVAEIKSWVTANNSALASPFSSESFGGYSYTKGKNKSGSDYGITWRDQFGDELKSRWGRMRLP